MGDNAGGLRVHTAALLQAHLPHTPGTPAEMVMDGDAGRERGGSRDLWWVIGLGRGRRVGIMGRGQKWMEGEMKRVDVSGRLLISNGRAPWRAGHLEVTKECKKEAKGGGRRSFTD